MTKLKTIDIYFLIEIRHIIMQCHGNYIEVKKFNYILEIKI